MSNLSDKLNEFRVTVFANNEISETSRVLLGEIHDIIKGMEDKEEAYRLWTNCFTGYYTLGGIE